MHAVVTLDARSRRPCASLAAVLVRARTFVTARRGAKRTGSPAASELGIAKVDCEQHGERDQS
jgi:hypothetical protein